MEADKYDFFFLGCWNNDDEDLDHRKQVLDLIEANTGENKYDFGLFLGDNIYKTKLKTKSIKGAPAEVVSPSKGAPVQSTKVHSANNSHKGTPSSSPKGGSRKKKMRRRKKTKKIRGGGKGKKIKVFNKATFEFLVNMIKEGNIGGKPIYFINGNHDIEDCIPKEIEPLLSKGNLIPDNTVNKLIKYTNQNYILILLDTNKGISRFLHDELSKIIVPDFNRWIILCGHIPLGSVKMKNIDSKKKDEVSVTQSFITLDSVMKALSKTGYKKFLYLCADTHNFQVNEIVNSKNLDIDTNELLLINQKHKVKDIEKDKNSIPNVTELPTSNLRIPEIVAGTGGADPDFVEAIRYPFHHPLRNSRRDNEIGLICHMYKPSYGFCDIKIEEKLVTVRYHQLVGEEEFISEEFINEVFIQNENSRENSNIILSKKILSKKIKTGKKFVLEKRTEMVIEDLCKQPK